MKPRYRNGARTADTKLHGNIRKDDSGAPRRETNTTARNWSRYSMLQVEDP